MSSFIDNPVVASLANLTGLTKVLGAGGTDAAMSAAAPHSPVQRPEYQLAHPMSAPRNMSYGSPQAQGTTVTTPGALSPETLQSPTVQQLLAHFGVSSDVPLDNHLFIHDPQAFAKHPLIAGAIDSALSGLANTRGADTVGEGLSNVAQGLAATHAQQIQQVNNQLMAPIMQASAVAQLQHQVGEQGRLDAQQKHDNAMADYYSNLLNSRETIANANNDTKETVANTNAGAKQATSKEAQFNIRVLNRVNTTPGNSFDKMENVPGDVWNKAYTDQQAAELVAPTNSKIQVKQATPGKAASVNAGVQKWKSPTDQKQYNDLDSQVGALAKQVQALDAGKATDENGTPVIDPQEIQARKQALFAQASQLRNRQGALAAANGVRSMASAPTAAPAAAPKITHQYIPGKGLVAVTQ